MRASLRVVARCQVKQVLILSARWIFADMRYKEAAS